MEDYKYIKLPTGENLEILATNKPSKAVSMLNDSQYKQLRLLYDKAKNNYYFYDAGKTDHTEVIKALGLDPRNTPGGMITSEKEIYELEKPIEDKARQYAGKIAKNTKGITRNIGKKAVMAAVPAAFMAAKFMANPAVAGAQEVLGNVGELNPVTPGRQMVIEGDPRSVVTKYPQQSMNQAQMLEAYKRAYEAAKKR